MNKDYLSLVGGVSFKELKTPQKRRRRHYKHMESYLYSFFLPYINIWYKNVQTSVLYEAFLPITSIKSRAGVTNYSKCMRSHVARDITMPQTVRMVRLCSYKLKKQGVYFVPRIICPSVSICFSFRTFSFFQKEFFPFCFVIFKIISLVFQFDKIYIYIYIRCIRVTEN